MIRLVVPIYHVSRVLLSFCSGINKTKEKNIPHNLVQCVAVVGVVVYFSTILPIKMLKFYLSLSFGFFERKTLLWILTIHLSV